MGSLMYLIYFNNPLESIGNNTLKRKHHMDVDFWKAHRMLQYPKREGWSYMIKTMMQGTVFKYPSQTPARRGSLATLDSSAVNKRFKQISERNRMNNEAMAAIGYS